MNSRQNFSKKFVTIVTTISCRGFNGGCKADPQKPEEFLEQELQPRLDEAQAGKQAVIFVDAAHFVLAPFLGLLWSVMRVFIHAPSGRQRFNVPGALNASMHELITLPNETYITAESVCALLEQIAKLYVGIPLSIKTAIAKCLEETTTNPTKLN